MSTGLLAKNKRLLNALKKQFNTDDKLVELVNTVLERSDSLSQVFVQSLFDLKENKLNKGMGKTEIISRLEAIKKGMGGEKPP